MTARSYCWTLNNYTSDDQECIARMIENHANVRYVCYGQEVGESGTPHLQGYIELKAPMRISALKKLAGFERGHFESRRGTRDQARSYCMKTAPLIEYGDYSSGGQGTRNDLRELMDAVKARPSETVTLMEMNPECYSRHQRFIEKYTCAVEKEATREFRKVEVDVLWGEAGSGKTKLAHESDPNIFTVNTDEAFPFDGYAGEKTILLDDFYGGIKYHNLLRILDGHQMRVNIKGSSRYACWTKVFITSNVGPADWYKHGLTPALKRRLTTVTEFSCHQEAGNTEPPLILEI